MNERDLKNIRNSIKRMSLNEIMVAILILGICSAASSMIGIPSFTLLYFSAINAVFMAIAVLLSTYLKRLSHKALAFGCYQLGGLAMGVLSGFGGYTGSGGLWVILTFVYMLITDVVLWLLLEGCALIAKKLSASSINTSQHYPISLIIWLVITYVALVVLSAKEVVYLMVMLALTIKFYQLFFVEAWSLPVKRAFVFSVSLPLVVSFVTTGYAIYLSDQLYSDAQSVANQALQYHDKTNEYPALEVLQEIHPNVGDFDDSYGNENFALTLLLGGGYIGHSDNQVIYENNETNDPNLTPYLAYVEPLTVLPCLYEYDFEMMQWHSGCEY